MPDADAPQPEPTVSAAEAQLAQAFQQFLLAQGQQSDDRVPATDEEGEDNVEFVKTGWIRCYIGREVWRLRAAFFGEVKTLLVLLENHQDELTRHRHVVNRQNAALQARLVEVDAMDETDEKWAAQTEIALELRALSRSVRDKADELRIEWWTKVFELLNVDRSGKTDRAAGVVPKQWPGWVADGDLPTRCVNHWRSVPLGRG